MSESDPFSKDPKDPSRPKTFWLKESTLIKLERVKEKAADKKKVIASVKTAIDVEVDRLEKLASEKE